MKPIFDKTLLRKAYSSKTDEVEKLQSWFASRINTPVSLVVTDNTKTMISAKTTPKGYRIRIHHMFLGAEARVLAGVLNYITGRSRRLDRRVRDFIHKNGHRIRKPQGGRKKRNPRLRARGKHVDLRASFNRLNKAFFSGTVDCAITWGNRRSRPRQRTIRLGSYSALTGIIRINPIMDLPFVPVYVIDHLVYHEILHHVLKAKVQNGRMISHGRTFRRMEQAYPHHEKAAAWLDKNLALLL